MSSRLLDQHYGDSPCSTYTAAASGQSSACFSRDAISPCFLRQRRHLASHYIRTVTVLAARTRWLDRERAVHAFQVTSSRQSLHLTVTVLAARARWLDRDRAARVFQETSLRQSLPLTVTVYEERASYIDQYIQQRASLKCGNAISSQSHRQ